jgi:hypothetical protein
MIGYSFRRTVRVLLLLSAALVISAATGRAQPLLCDGDTVTGSSDFLPLAANSVRFSARTRVTHSSAHPTCFGSMWVRVTVNGVPGSSGPCPSADASEAHTSGGPTEALAQVTCNAPANMQLCGEYNYRAQGEHRWNDQALAPPNDFTVSAPHYRLFCEENQCVEDCEYSAMGPGECSFDQGYIFLEDCNCCAYAYSPIVVDVAGNGFSFTNAVNGVQFDLNRDGVRERLSWTAAGSDDAWLVLDRDANGMIENGGEMFGNFTPQPISEDRNGFLALAGFDVPAEGGNGDGWVTRDDSIFPLLQLWRDINHNGVSEPTELFGLEEAGITKLSLDYRQSKRRDKWGNWFRLKARVIDRRDTDVGRFAYDVYLKVACNSARTLETKSSPRKVSP